MGLHKVPSPRRRRRPFVGTDNDEQLALSFRTDEDVDTTEQVDSSSDDKFDLDFLCIPFRKADTARLNIFHESIDYNNFVNIVKTSQIWLK